MAMDLKWMLSADDKASGVFDKVKSAGVGAAEGITGAFEGAASKFNLITGAFGALAGVAGGMAFKDIISHTVDWELSNAKLANTLGVTTEEASVFSVAMKSVGVDQDTAQSAAMRLSMTMNKNREIFDQIGVSVTNANGSTRDGISVMMDVNKKLLDQNAGFDRNTMALKLYGRGWADIQPLLKATNKVMDESKDTTEKLGLTVHKDGVDAAKAYKIAMIEFSEAAHAVEIQLGSELLPVITEVAKVLGHDVVVAAGLSKAVIQGIKENSDAVAIALTGLAAPAILSGMTALATGIKGISFSMVALEAASLNAQCSTGSCGPLRRGWLYGWPGDRQGHVCHDRS